MRKTALLMAIVGLLVASAAGASAAVFGADIDRAVVSGGQVVSISGTIACTQGDEYLLRVNVFDRDGNTAIGRASGTCTGNPQEYVTSVVESDSGFACGELLGGHGQARAGGDQKSFSDRTQAVCP